MGSCNSAPSPPADNASPSDSEMLVASLHSLTPSERDKILNPTDSGKSRSRGASIFESGGQYIGEYQNADGVTRSGKGIYTFENGDIYDGAWKDGLFSGRGKMTYAEMSDSSPREVREYEGEWLEGKKAGQGKMIYVSDDTYEGQWQDDEFDGFGIYRYSDGEFYEGNHMAGKRDGYGKYTFLEGNNFTRFEGMFESNCMRAGKLFIEKRSKDVNAAPSVSVYEANFTGGKNKNDDGNRIYALSVTRSDNKVKKTGIFINGRFTDGDFVDI